MIGFLLGDGLDVVVEGGVETGRGESGLRELGKSLAVESILEMFEGEGVIQNVNYIGVRSRSRAVLRGKCLQSFKDAND